MSHPTGHTAGQKCSSGTVGGHVQGQQISLPALEKSFHRHTGISPHQDLQHNSTTLTPCVPQYLYVYIQLEDADDGVNAEVVFVEIAEGDQNEEFLFGIGPGGNLTTIT